MIYLRGFETSEKNPEGAPPEIADETLWKTPYGTLGVALEEAPGRISWRTPGRTSTLFGKNSWIIERIFLM